MNLMHNLGNGWICSHTTGTLGGHDPQHAEKLLRFAKAMVSTAATVLTPLGDPVQMRVGESLLL